MRLKGTWSSTDSANAPYAKEPSVSAMDRKADGPGTTNELQVNEAEVVGPSDPQVREKTTLLCG